MGWSKLLAAFRWFILLRVQDVHLPPWRVGALLMLGIFFNMFMPGGTGGDVLKIYFLLKEIPKKKGGGPAGGADGPVDRAAGADHDFIGYHRNPIQLAENGSGLAEPDMGFAFDPGSSLGGNRVLIYDQRIRAGAPVAGEDADAGQADRSVEGLQRVCKGMALFAGGAVRVVLRAPGFLLPLYLRSPRIERECIDGGPSDGDADHPDAGGDAGQRGRSGRARGAVRGVAGAALHISPGRRRSRCR